MYWCLFFLCVYVCVAWSIYCISSMNKKCSYWLWYLERLPFNGSRDSRGHTNGYWLLIENFIPQTAWGYWNFIRISQLSGSTVAIPLLIINANRYTITLEGSVILNSLEFVIARLSIYLYVFWPIPLTPQKKQTTKRIASHSFFLQLCI